MKKISYLWSLLTIMMVAMLSVGVTSCGSDDDDPSEINVNPSSVMFEADGGSVSIMVSSNTSWTISGVPSWLQVSTISGKNNQQVMLTANGNTTQDSRNGMLNIIADDGSVSAAVSLTQPGIKIDENEVINTTWEATNWYADGSRYVYALTFGTTTAQYSETYIEGTASITNVADYTFKRNNNIVVLSPVKAGDATLEGKIEDGIKMVMTNTSDFRSIILYKK